MLFRWAVQAGLGSFFLSCCRMNTGQQWQEYCLRASLYLLSILQMPQETELKQTFMQVSHFVRMNMNKAWWGVKKYIWTWVAGGAYGLFGDLFCNEIHSAVKQAPAVRVKAALVSYLQQYLPKKCQTSKGRSWKGQLDTWYWSAGFSFSAGVVGKVSQPNWFWLNFHQGPRWSFDILDPDWQ